MTTFEKIAGPRLPSGEWSRPRYTLPTFFFALAALCLLVSFFLPYWKMTLQAPQYPKGLHVRAYLNHLEGDVKEIDGLNHYIGMRPLESAATLEKSLSIYAVVVLALLVIAAAYVHNRFAVLLAIPAMLLPAMFLVDLQLWLRFYGTNLDPHAALSSSIKPFVPPALGVGKVGQFSTVASIDQGMALAIVASLLMVVGFYFHRRAYKPLVDAAVRQG